MNTLRPLLLAMACALPLVATAQWQWLDKDGRKVFSDRPPPADIPAGKVLRQPGGKAPEAAAAEANAAAGAAPAQAGAAPALAGASAPKMSTTDKSLEDKRKQAEAAEAAKKKEADAKLAQARADNCTRAKANKATYDSGVRIARPNAKGEREFIDDKQREAEVKRLQEIIAKDCA